MKQSFPAGVKTLFLILAFAIIPFSILYSSIMLYATNQLHLSDSVATGITASYLAFNSGLSLLGGYVVGRYLSYRIAFIIAMLAQVIGCCLLSVPSLLTFSWGLAAILVGACFAVTCINCMLTQLFNSEDKRYSIKNLGAFLGFAVSGYCQLHDKYHELFLLGALGNIFAAIITLVNWKTLRDINTHLVTLSCSKKTVAALKGILIVIGLLFSLRLLLGHANLSNNLVMSVGIAMILVISFIAIQQKTDVERNKIWAYLILSFTALIFWTLYLSAPMALIIFIERNVNLHYLGTLIAPQWVQNINTLVIILGGPVLSVVFNKMREQGIQFTIATQFSIALLLIGIALAILPLGIHYSNSQGYTSFNWVLMSYILQSSGELFLSPIGYAMVGQLIPVRLQGLLMGTWLMITGVSATTAEYFAKMALQHTQSIDPLVTNQSFSHAFGLLGWISIASALILYVISPWLTRLTQEYRLNLSVMPA
jgi:POT family proton-dependent oligopeptide transporter